MSLTAVPFYELRYQPHPPLLWGHARRNLSPTEFTEACELLLDHARQHQCPFWLLDGRDDDGYHPPDLHQWMLDEYLPRVWRELQQPLHLAFVAGPAFWQRLRARGYARPAPSAQPVPFQAVWCEDEAQARAWLDEHRPPALAEAVGQLCPA